jgi:hypothetical protein
MQGIKLIALDTCFVRNVIHNNKLKNGKYSIDELEEIITLKKDFIYRISETSLAELMIALGKKDIDITEWKQRINLLDSLLYSECPILPMGLDLAYEMKIRKFREDYIPASNEYWNCSWSLLRNLQTSEGMTVPQIFDDNGVKRQICFNLEKAEQVMKENRCNWICDYYSTRKMVVEWNDKNELQITDFKDYLTLIVGNFENDGYDVNKIETMCKTAALYHYRYGKNEYHPDSKNSYNDSLDFSLLQILEYPAILVSNDGHLIKRVEAACGQRKNILTSSELLEFLKSDNN